MGTRQGSGMYITNILHFGICFKKLERDAISQHLDFNIVVKLMGVKERSHQCGYESLHPLLGHLLPSAVTCTLMSIVPVPAGSSVFSSWMCVWGSLLRSLSASRHSPPSKRVSDTLHLYIWRGTSGCLRESSGHVLVPSWPGSLRKPAPDTYTCCFCG